MFAFEANSAHLAGMFFIFGLAVNPREHKARKPATTPPDTQGGRERVKRALHQRIFPAPARVKETVDGRPAQQAILYIGDIGHVKLSKATLLLLLCLNRSVTA